MLSKADVLGLLEVIHNRLVNGCGNNGCVVKFPKGVATNGACRCTPQEIRKLIVETALGLTNEHRWAEEPDEHDR